jgi:hypothetical protein
MSDELQLPHKKTPFVETIYGLTACAVTWQGRMLENNGITPKFLIELSREALKQGSDTQLGTAIDVAKAL